MGSLHIVPAPRQIARSRYIEALREKEYRQLRGKTYLDHGGTTVKLVVRYLIANKLTGIAICGFTA
jgi:hypothetical protein